MNLDDVVLIIPAYNEEASLPLVLGDLPDVGKVIVADNASTDRTAELAREGGALVATELRRGYGSACLAGLRELESLVGTGYPEPRVVAFLDGDYSDYPEQLVEIVGPILRGEADFVLGSRLLGQREPGAMPPQSLYGNRLACALMRLLFNAKYSDLGPFRAMDYQKFCELGMRDTNFGWTVEMQIKAVKASLRILEIPVHYRKRIGVSKISGTLLGTLLAGSKILYTIAKYGLWQKAAD